MKNPRKSEKWEKIPTKNDKKKNLIKQKKNWKIGENPQKNNKEMTI